MMSGNGQGGKWDLRVGRASIALLAILKRERGGLREDAFQPCVYFLGSYAFFWRHSDMK